MINNMENAFSVKGKNILITGGNRGIGKGISTAMAQSGANVAILARNEESSIATIEELNQYGGDHRYYYGDVTDIKKRESGGRDCGEGLWFH